MTSFLFSSLCACTILLDCAFSPSFVHQAQDADYVAVCWVAHNGGYQWFELRVLERIKGADSSDRITAWARSECHENRSDLFGIAAGDTVVIAVDAITKNDTCDLTHSTLIEKAAEHTYRTSNCGNNSIVVKNGIAIGCITKPFGQLEDVGFAPYQKQ